MLTVITYSYMFDVLVMMYIVVHLLISDVIV